MHSSRRATIVVGVSGSRASVDALRWAAEEAPRRGARLVAVRAWQPAPYAHYAAVASRPDTGHQRQAVTWELASTLRSAFGARLPGHLFTEVTEGSAERVLVDCSAGADLLVLGSASPPYLSGRSIGPVIRSCLSRAHCPVVVIGREGLADVLSATTAAGETGAADRSSLLPVRPGSHVSGLHDAPVRRQAKAGALLSAMPSPRLGD